MRPHPDPGHPVRIGLGCVTFGREIDEVASRALMDHAWQRGVTLFDTASACGNGASERIIGHCWRTTGSHPPVRPKAMDNYLAPTKVGARSFVMATQIPASYVSAPGPEPVKGARAPTARKLSEII